MIPPRRTPNGKLGRKSGSQTSAWGLAPRRPPFVGLDQHCLVIIATLANAVWLAIPAPLSCIGTLSMLTSRLFPCNRFKTFTLLSVCTTCTITSPSSPGEPPANSTHKEHGAPSNPRKPPQPLCEGGHPSPSRKPDPLAAVPEARPLPTPSSSPNIREWTQMLQTHTHEEFASLALLQKDHTCPPCMDVSGVVLIRPSQIHRYVFGEWQETMDIQECLEGIFRNLQLDPAISLL